MSSMRSVLLVNSKGNKCITVEAAYMGRLGTGLSGLLYSLSLISSTIDMAKHRSMRAN